MNTHSHRSSQRLVQRLFTSGLSGSAHAKLARSLDACPLCLDEYRTFQRLEACLVGSDPEPTVFALERIERLVLSRIAAPASKRRLSWIAVPAAAALAASVLIALLIFPTGPGSDRIHLESRFAGHPVSWLAAKGSSSQAVADIGFRAFVVESPETVVESRSSLKLDDVITFTYTNVSVDYRYLALFGIQEDGAVRWYYPDYNEEQSIAIAGDRVDEPLDHGIRLGVNHRPGWLRITALFSSQPLSRGSIEMAASKLGPAAHSVERPLVLDGPGIPMLLQYATLIELDGQNAGVRP